MDRARVAPRVARQLVVLIVLLASVWLAGLLLAWGLAMAAPHGPAAIGPASPSGPSIEVAPRRWMLAPADMG